MVDTIEFFVPLTGMVNAEEEIAKMEAEIAHLTKFLKGVEAKLSNERFVQNAPEAVVAMERKKQSDATTKIENLKNSIANLKK
jgi:valyl-tRNA synthetase